MSEFIFEVKSKSVNISPIVMSLNNLYAKELAEQLGVHIHTIRNWDKKQLWPIWALRFLNIKILVDGEPLDENKKISIAIADKWNLSQRELAKQIGHARSSLNRWDNQDTWPLFSLIKAGCTFELEAV
jgi:DNA-binding XRE family transcriptional regulator